jgi:hypothetical protein
MAAFEGRDFLSTAALLANQSDDEGAQRSAISRSCYACFHRARDLADAREAAVRRDGSAHVAVRRFVGTVDSSIEWDLNRLHKLRKYADYDIPFPVGDPLEAAQSAMDLASTIIAAIDAVEVEVANEVGSETQEE